ncbi:MAG: hypothetical protein J6K90_04985 [Tidjanibacter sp.]|nr:hypothetical protein [Tidjanibacter sp.]
MKKLFRMAMIVAVAAMSSVQIYAQMGTRFPSERKVMKDPVTGVELIFLTNKAGSGDSKTYHTHNQWTADGNWQIFRSNRVRGEAMAVNLHSGAIVQVTEGGYNGYMNVSQKDMILFISRPHLDEKQAKQLEKYNKEVAELRAKMTPQQLAAGQVPQPKTKRPVYGMEYVKIDLAALFADSEAGTLKPAAEYETVLGVTPAEWGGGEMQAIDGMDEKYAYFLTSEAYAHTRVPEGMKLEENFGMRNMGAGPSGMAYMDLTTGECHYIRTIPFKVGHVQGNYWHNDEVIFCWETGGKAATRMWAMNRDGSDFRPLYRELETDWITHEAVISADEIAFAVLGHRPIRMDHNEPPMDAWGISGTREYATGLAIVNMRTREFELVGQALDGNNVWFAQGSDDGHWALGEDFKSTLWIFDRHTKEVRMLTTGHNANIRPSFSPDNTMVSIQSSMLAEDGRSGGICVVKLPQELLDRYNK